MSLGLCAIFSSIFPDLGDLQLEELRQAIKKSYDDRGWGEQSSPAVERSVPPFRAFFDILGAKTKPNLGLLARLQELADYGFFDGAGEQASLLDERRPTIVRIHEPRMGHCKMHSHRLFCIAFTKICSAAGPASNHSRRHFR